MHPGKCEKFLIPVSLYNNWKHWYEFESKLKECLRKKISFINYNMQPQLENATRLIAFLKKEYDIDD